MLTRNRRKWLPKAIACFQSQTYKNRELLIIADGEDVKDLIPDDPRIRLIHIESGRTIGEKRNFGVSHSRDALVCHWDDDDWSAPERLVDQVGRLQESGLAVTGYSSMLFTDGAAWWRWTYDYPGFALGTSLCYSREWAIEHPFPALQVHEDGEFVLEARRYRKVVSVDAGELMVATIHAGNTSRRTLTGDGWEKLADFAGVPGLEFPCD